MSFLDPRVVLHELFLKHRGDQLVLVCPGLSQFQHQMSYIQGNPLDPGKLGWQVTLGSTDAVWSLVLGAGDAGFNKYQSLPL